MNKKRWMLALLFAAILSHYGAGTAARAGIFNLRPTAISLQPGTLTSTVTLENPGSQQLLIEAMAFRWHQERGEDRLEPTQDLIVVPPVFTLEPGASQTVRVGLPSAPDSVDPREIAWRVVFSEVPDATAERFGVNIALEISIPVFFVPAGTEPGFSWELQRGDAVFEVGLKNSGSKHLKVFNLKLYQDGNAEPTVTIDRGAYVLPGSSRSWSFESAPFSRSQGLRLMAETNVGLLEANWSGCAKKDER